MKRVSGDAHRGPYILGGPPVHTDTARVKTRRKHKCVKHVIILAFWLHLGNRQCDTVEKDCESKRTIPPTIPPIHPIHKKQFFSQAFARRTWARHRFYRATLRPRRSPFCSLITHKLADLQASYTSSARLAMWSPACDWRGVDGVAGEAAPAVDVRRGDSSDALSLPARDGVRSIDDRIGAKLSSKGSTSLTTARAPVSEAPLMRGCASGTSPSSSSSTSGLAT